MKLKIEMKVYCITNPTKRF